MITPRIQTRTTSDFNIADDINSLQEQIGDIFKIIDEFGDWVQDESGHVRIDSRDITSAFKTLKNKIWKSTSVMDIISIVNNGGNLNIETDGTHNFFTGQRIVLSQTGVSDYDSFGTVLSALSPNLTVSISYTADSSQGSISSIGGKIQQHGDDLIPRGVVFFIFGRNPSQGGLNECPPGYMECNSSLIFVNDVDSILTYFEAVNDASGLNNDTIPDFTNYYIRGHGADSLHNSTPLSLNITIELGDNAGMNSHDHEILHTHTFDHKHIHVHYMRHNHEMPIHRHKIPIHKHLLGEFRHTHNIDVSRDSSFAHFENIVTSHSDSKSYDPNTVITHNHELQSATTNSTSHGIFTHSQNAESRGYTDYSDEFDISNYSMGELSTGTKGVKPDTRQNVISDQQTGSVTTISNIFPTCQYVKMCMKI